MKEAQRATVRVTLQAWRRDVSWATYRSGASAAQTRGNLQLVNGMNKKQKGGGNREDMTININRNNYGVILRGLQEWQRKRNPTI